jgi:glycerol-3-phosphate dehydrogenase
VVSGEMCGREGVRPPFTKLDGENFDLAIVGAGVNGASAAQHLSAVGYSVLLVDEGDFASGSSNRSSRLLHCGLRYLAPGSSIWEFVRHPGLLAVAVRMAKQAMECRAQLVTTASACASRGRTAPLLRMANAEKD